MGIRVQKERNIVQGQLREQSCDPDVRGAATVKVKETERMPSSLGTFPRTWAESQEEEGLVVSITMPHYFPRSSITLLLLLLFVQLSTVTMPPFSPYSPRLFTAESLHYMARSMDKRTPNIELENCSSCAY
jgi:hypothetical protein